MPYIDGYVLAVPVKKIPAYRKIARMAGKVYLKHGALRYCECVADDLKTPAGLRFDKLLSLKRGETAVFSYIVFKNKAHRNKVNAKVMADPRLLEMCKVGEMPFDLARMSWGGFKPIVDMK